MALATALLAKPAPYGTPAAPLYNGVFVGGHSYYAPAASAQPAAAPTQSGAVSSPSAPSGAQPGTASTGGGSYGGAVSAGPNIALLDKQASPLLSSLSSLDTVLGNRNQQAQDDYDRAITGYNAQDALDKQAYDQNVTQNNQNFTSGNQRALLNAANASTGLRGVLGSLGALAGSGAGVINHLVGNAENSDLGDARGTFDTNARTLSNDFARTDQLEKQRRADAGATLSNAKQNAQADVLNSRQSILQQLANLYGADTSQGVNYANDAAALAGPIANTTRATVAPYQAASSLYSPTALQDYLSGTRNLTVNTSGGSQTPVNSPSYVAPGGQKKDTLPGVA